jgi:hypothetical protein
MPVIGRPARVRQLGGHERVEARGDVERDRLSAALDEPVDVQVARRDRDPPLGEDPRLVARDLGREPRREARLAEQGGEGVQRCRRIGPLLALLVERERPLRGPAVEVLPRVAVGVQPVLDVEREVALGVDRDRGAADLPGDVDRPVEVLDRHGAVLVDDVSDDVEVAVARRHAEGGGLRRGAAVALTDPQALRGHLTRRSAQDVGVEVDVARVERDERPVLDRHALVVADDDVLDAQRERGGVLDRDGAARARLQRRSEQRGVGRARVGLDEDRARGGVDRRQLHEDRVELAVDDLAGPEDAERRVGRGRRPARGVREVLLGDQHLLGVRAEEAVLGPAGGEDDVAGLGRR